MHTNLFKILCFSCQGKSRDIVYQRICLFLWLIFAQHGFFEIQLSVFSALSRLTDLGIYDITRCGIWLLTIFHIPYIRFQRELRKVTSPKWYLSFLFSIAAWDLWLFLFTNYLYCTMMCIFRIVTVVKWTEPTLGLIKIVYSQKECMYYIHACSIHVHVMNHNQPDLIKASTASVNQREQ